MQLTHYTSKFKPRSFPITIICDGLSSPYNIGGMFRIADAFGVEHIIFLNTTEDLGKRFKKASRSAEKYVKYSISNDFEEVYINLLSRNYYLIALEITEKSIPLNDFHINKDHPIAIIIGGENLGISDTILSKVENHVHINMYGVNSSMNVVQSASIVLYELTNQLK
ncbi:MAG: TrmH family RNA methyltransferase [Bacteroidota bacterium]